MELFKIATKLLLAIIYIITLEGYSDKFITTSVIVATVFALYYITKLAIYDNKNI